MNILVSTLYSLLFTNSYFILHLYHNTLFVNRNAHVEPTNLTWMLFPFPATLPAKVGTDRKIVRCRSSPCQSCRRKAFEKRSKSCRLKRWKAAEPPLQFAVISLVSGDAITWILLPTISSVFSDQSQPPGELICHWLVVEGFMALEARSGAITTRERSPPPPLDLARSEVSNSSFPSPSVEIRSPLVGMGISVMFTWMQLKLT